MSVLVLLNEEDIGGGGGGNGFPATFPPFFSDGSGSDGGGGGGGVGVSSDDSFFDGIHRPQIRVYAGFGGVLDPGPDYLHLGVGPGLGTGKLGGAGVGVNEVDITGSVRGVSLTQRGRGSDIDAAEPVTATLVLNNFSGDYDPANPASPYTGQLVDGTPNRVRWIWQNQAYDRFYGELVDITHEVANDWDITATFTCLDGQEKLGRAYLPQTTPQLDGDTSGERIGHLADQAGQPTTLRAIDTGYTTVAPTILGAPALELMRAAEQTEFGLLFVDGSGRLTFYDRHRGALGARSATLQAVFGDTPVNWLTGDTATFDTSLGGWVNSSNSTPAQSTAQAHAGAGSMRLTSVAAGDMEAKHTTDALLGTTGVPVAAGQTYTISGWFRAATTGRDCQIRVSFYTASGGDLLETQTGSSVTDTTTGWVQSTGVFTAPGGATVARVRARVQATGGASEQHYVDDVAIIGGVIPLRDVSLARTRDRTFNRVAVTRDPVPNLIVAPPTGSQDDEAPDAPDEPVEQIADDPTSQGTRGVLGFPTQVGQVLRNDAEALALAQYLVGRFAATQNRISELNVSTLSCPTTLYAILLGLGPLDRVAVSQGYGPATITTQLLIQGVTESIQADPPAWDLQFTTSPTVPAPTLFKLGTAQLGSSTTGKLGW